MPGKSIRALVCEGPDDLAAIRALLREQGISPGRRHSIAQGHLEFESEACKLLVEFPLAEGRGKDKLAERALLLAEGTASERPDVVAVCFDPDTSPETNEFDFFIKDFAEAASRRAGPLSREDQRRFRFRIQRREVLLLAAPWRCAEETFAGLPDEHNLERVLIAGIRSSQLDGRLQAWAEEATTKLLGLLPRHGWKRAFRIWNAAIRPGTESFVDGLTQEDGTRAHCLAALRKTAVAEVLFDLLGIPGTSPHAP